MGKRGNKKAEARARIGEFMATHHKKGRTWLPEWATSESKAQQEGGGLNSTDSAHKAGSGNPALSPAEEESNG